ncbi:MAG: SH3 domain-containing protein [Spirochaetales bacterium]|nr:SH3 domain-containing protein [Spirochaetales bacterium]
MRSGATLSSEVVAVIPYQEQVKVLEILRSTGPLDIQGRTGYWCRIQWNGTTGYVFGGFLELAPGLELLRELPTIWVQLADNEGELFIWANPEEPKLTEFIIDLDAEFHGRSYYSKDYKWDYPPAILFHVSMDVYVGGSIKKVQKDANKYIISIYSFDEDKYVNTWEISYFKTHVIIAVDKKGYKYHFVEKGFEYIYPQKTSIPE